MRERKKREKCIRLEKGVRNNVMHRNFLVN
jgi:hypothetical protein